MTSMTNLGGRISRLARALGLGQRVKGLGEPAVSERRISLYDIVVAGQMAELHKDVPTAYHFAGSVNAFEYAYRMEVWDSVRCDFAFGGTTYFRPPEHELEDAMAVIPTSGLIFLASGRGVAEGMANCYFSGAKAAHAWLGAAIAEAGGRHDRCAVYPEAARALVEAASTGMQVSSDVHTLDNLVERAASHVPFVLSENERTWMNTFCMIVDVSRRDLIRFLPVGDYAIYRVRGQDVTAVFAGATMFQYFQEHPEALPAEADSLMREPKFQRKLFRCCVTGKGAYYSFVKDRPGLSESTTQPGDMFFILNHGLATAIWDLAGFRAALPERSGTDVLTALFEAGNLSRRRLSMQPAALYLKAEEA